MSASLTPKVAFNVAKDFRPISLLASTPMLLAIHPSVPAKTLADLIRLAKAPGNKLSYASGGTGGVQHLATELFKHEAKVDLLHVPYKGSGPGIVDLLAGNVQITMTGVAPLLAFINAGKLRGLAITGTSRSPALPNVPTFAESGLPGVVIDGWHGMLAPAATPDPTVRKLAGTVSQVARMPEVTSRLANEGAVPVGNSPDEFAKFFTSERQRWTKLAETLGIKE
jgi:tripartite-type tricarboxylate transporter receptor subunit TctC